MTRTIHQTINELHRALSDYIEATYHISAPSLIAQRKRLLDETGVIHQVPYVESTPRYVAGKSFQSIDGLPAAALEMYSRLAQEGEGLPKLIHDPPYKHQSDAIRSSLVDERNLLIMTGTGSGKTESFLLPILGKLAKEARESPQGFGQKPAMRALVLYPMNALVNDQLGRLRALFGDRRLVDQFTSWSGRPPRFARYTSRTPYPGVRTREKDSARLRAFESFYVDVLRRASSEDPDDALKAKQFIAALQVKGKWPAKEDMAAWMGEKGSSWRDADTGEFIRAVTMQSDAELLTRHEVQAAPPDLLVTNYSMLEYMLMRPIERSVFDSTRDWLTENPDEKFVIVLDEAHLYRGAAGAEVGLLIRRLRDRLAVPPERIQVICATASFQDKEYAPNFGEQVSGIPAETFEAITGDLAYREYADGGSDLDAQVLAGIDVDSYYEAESDDSRMQAIEALLEYRGVKGSANAEADLYAALRNFDPIGQLVNCTMDKAQRVSDLGGLLFPDSSQEKADAAVTSLMALGSTAREIPGTAGLLPARIHNFFRGLPGLWVCMNPDCDQISDAESEGICGRMYSQPEEQCACGSRVLELYTCRNCGTAYARAYTTDVDAPSALWREPGKRLRIGDGGSEPLHPLDLLLEEPVDEQIAEPADYDLETGRINPKVKGHRMRRVYIRSDRTFESDDEDGEQKSSDSRGQFVPCAVCQKRAKFGRSYVQDHQTKGDQPFQALVARQLQIQPPSAKEATSFAPLQGRKVLTFSDSRQVAARLAPNLQMFSTRDSLRPLIAWGFTRLQFVPVLQPQLSLEDLYLAVLLASKELGIRLRPELKSGETYAAESRVEQAVKNGETETDGGILALCLEMRSESPPESLLESMVTTLQDRFVGFEALATASICERAKHVDAIAALPDIPGVATTRESKRRLAGLWIRCWLNSGFWINSMPASWENRKRAEGVSVKTRKAKSRFTAIDRLLPDKASRSLFSTKWHPALVGLLTQDSAGGNKRLRGSELSLEFSGDWVQCRTCRSVHRSLPEVTRCVDCGSDTIEALDPTSDEVFLARKGFYRKPVAEALGNPPRRPLALVAAEHTAQLNAPQNEDVFSKAEENELLFQDIALPQEETSSKSTAIDILSSTTTMEVGIDLGALSGVALRNMPPSRANYQQRAGRAGRRGHAVATVIAFGSADSHDEHYFAEPDEMIRGKVVDPKLTLDNDEITRRHIRAFLLQNYHQYRISEIDPDQPHDLFSVLGTVLGFSRPESLLNRQDFEKWLSEHADTLRERVAAWIPRQLSSSKKDKILREMIEDCLLAVDQAVGHITNGVSGDSSETDSSRDHGNSGDGSEDLAGDALQSDKLLDRLLYCGKLPRYAFPTDVATFHVFDREQSSRYRAVMRYAPSQGLPIALSQYAPGKQVWIAGKCYTSGAIYSAQPDDRFEAWQSKRIYMECTDCGYARTFSVSHASPRDTDDCTACGGEGTFGPARYWMRPPGFAHPVDEQEVTSPDEIPETSYATRAKLTMGTPGADAGWQEANERVRALPLREHLLVSNTGPSDEGYMYCVKCGRIEASTTKNPTLGGPHHKPYPEEESRQVCEGNATSRHLVLGTDFITDVVLLSLKVAAPLNLRPGHYPTEIAMRTLSEALAQAACQMLEVESGELSAEFRPALTPAGANGLEAEIFLYDTLPGGAGFASQLAGDARALFNKASTILQSCPEGCDSSCYRCLRSFKNRFDHILLDRHVGAELIEYLIYGRLPPYNERRMEAATSLLFNDLHRQDDGTLKYWRNETIKIRNGDSLTAPILVENYAGQQVVVALSGALSGGHPADPKLRDELHKGTGLPVYVENELMVRGNLAVASQNVRNYMQTRAQ